MLRCCAKILALFPFCLENNLEMIGIPFLLDHLLDELVACSSAFFGTTTPEPSEPQQDESNSSEPPSPLFLLGGEEPLLPVVEKMTLSLSLSFFFLNPRLTTPTMHHTHPPRMIKIITLILLAATVSSRWYF